jgi:hypothetical protein
MCRFVYETSLIAIHNPILNPIDIEALGLKDIEAQRATEDTYTIQAIFNAG